MSGSKGEQIMASAMQSAEAATVQVGPDPWADSPVWQQIRDQDYTHALLLGVEPHRVRIWCVPKDVLRAHAVPQHTGSTGTETLWLTVQANDIPDWMHPYGGELDLAACVTRTALP